MKRYGALPSTKRIQFVIKFLHAICKIGMALWTLLCGLMALTPMLTMFKTTSAEEATAMGAASIAVWFILGAVWFFPMLVMVIAAYITRPQAWAEKATPASINQHPTPAATLQTAMDSAPSAH